MGNDLKRLIQAYCFFIIEWRKHVFRPTRLLTSNGSSSIQVICANCKQVLWRLQNPAFLLQEPVLLHGFRSADLQKQSQRYHYVFERQSKQTLSHGNPWKYFSQQPLQREYEQGLAHLRRAGSSTHQYSKETLC